MPFVTGHVPELLIAVDVVSTSVFSRVDGAVEPVESERIERSLERKSVFELKENGWFSQGLRGFRVGK